ncbi:uncharacterized protein TRIADDRAFT_51036 [Trichoplax adhaerens]|uniref:Alpha-1,3-mannosyl-glycoprotein 2-beta-N-acetylglucosaminyltransferase n=1 Tax=Trichoplax adhaerens TaxID=10228 RepID=B3SAL5_TRIAD|nr:hypothetical protein TRIADDRAFT_51036 [Trichoplax adhaerens]EDV20334.1 hypothetical protein TRIADDRAFT_51036 [Trichoplax adhaerens]|eukprot:XP_002117284.1 hypothetical protein TRIADDRAFT_51036 [Trichoplax adhaerens]
MAARRFDTYAGKADNLMIQFIDMVSDDRILCFTILDEGTFSIRKHARQALAMLGSKYALTIKWRDMWTMIIAKNGVHYAEARALSPKLDEWAKPCKISAQIQLKTNQERRCNWPKNDENRRRATLCNRYEGYGRLCACSNPQPIDIASPSLLNNRVANVPVAVIASNRPYYLFRMLQSLLSAKGATKSLITVFIDGFFDEPLAVCNLFGIRAVQHKPVSKRNGRIAQHYKASLSAAFDLHPEAKYLIVLEEDLDVSVDFFSYFSQTLPLIDDKDIYCISAWNDQGYKHSSNDPTRLYRVETMPGLGWMLKRSLFKEELEPHWPGPEAFFDWDMWMRTPTMRKGRECVIPDISRTFHFGSQGVNMNNYFQDAYFTAHKLNTDANAVLRGIEDLRQKNYEKLMHKLVQNAVVLNHAISPCHHDFVPNTTDVTYVVYIQMTKLSDYETWLQIAKCWKLWDLDVRGFHKSTWRLWIKKNPILIVGHPVSPYSSYKPKNIKPIFIKGPTKPPKKT